MSAKLLKTAISISALSLCALRGPIHRSGVRFDIDPPVVDPPAPVPAARVSPTPMQTIRGLIATRASLTASLDEQRALVAARDQELTTATTALATLRAEHAALQARVSVFEQEAATHAQAVEALAKDRKDFDALMSEAVAGQMSTLGVPLVQLPASVPVPAAETAGEIFAKWESFKGKEKSAYYKKHEAILSKPQPVQPK